MIAWAAGFLAGFGLGGRLPPGPALRVWLAVGCGFGGASLVLYAWLLLGKPGLAALGALELGALAGAWAFARRAAAADAAGVSTARATERPSPALLALLACATLVCGIAVARMLLVYPFGEWDAIEIWNYRALAFTRGDLAAGFREARHADYPLLVPLLVTHAWTWLGEAPALSMGVSVAFAVATVGLLYTASARVGGPVVAAAVTIALLAAPLFAYNAGSQRADVPLSMFMLGAVVCLVVGDRERDPRVMALAGVHIGCAAWTKNEGLLFAGVVAVAWLASLGRGSVPVRRALPVLVGALPFAASVAVHKLTSGGASDLAAGQGPATWQRLADPERYAQIAAAFGRHAAYYAGVALALGILLPRAAPASEAVPERSGPAVALVALTSAGMLAGYFATYLITPHDLGWHLWSSIERLFVQLWPLTLFGVALASAPRSPRA